MTQGIIVCLLNHTIFSITDFIGLQLCYSSTFHLLIFQDFDSLLAYNFLYIKASNFENLSLFILLTSQSQLWKHSESQILKKKHFFDYIHTFLVPYLIPIKVWYHRDLLLCNFHTFIWPPNREGVICNG